MKRLKKTCFVKIWLVINRQCLVRWRPFPSWWLLQIKELWYLREISHFKKFVKVFKQVKDLKLICNKLKICNQTLLGWEWKGNIATVIKEKCYKVIHRFFYPLDVVEGLLPNRFVLSKMVTSFIMQIQFSDSVNSEITGNPMTFHSPDRKLCDFFLLGYRKDFASAKNATADQDLMKTITRIITWVTVDMSKGAIRNILVSMKI